MTHTLRVHGFSFNVECGGFQHAEADRDAGIAAIDDALSAMDPDHLAALHAASLAWTARQCDGERPSELETIERIGETTATADWARPGEAWLSVSAAR